MAFENIRIIEESELLVNARNPQGELGGKLIERMNVNHEGLARWSLNHLNISKDVKILDMQFAKVVVKLFMGLFQRCLSEMIPSIS